VAVFLRTEMHDIAGAPRAPDPGHPAGSYLTEAAGSWTCCLRRSSSAAMDTKPRSEKMLPRSEKIFWRCPIRRRGDANRPQTPRIDDDGRERGDRGVTATAYSIPVLVVPVNELEARSIGRTREFAHRVIERRTKGMATTPIRDDRGRLRPVGGRTRARSPTSKPAVIQAQRLPTSSISAATCAPSNASRSGALRWRFSLHKRLREKRQIASCWPLGRRQPLIDVARSSRERRTIRCSAADASPSARGSCRCASRRSPLARRLTTDPSRTIESIAAPEKKPSARSA
jgi:hypothetical protein